MRLFRHGLEAADRIGDRLQAAALTVSLAEALYLQGRTEEAARQLEQVPEGGQRSFTVGSARWRITRARVLALQGDVAEAEPLAREAAALLASTDLLDLRGDAAVGLAEVLRAHGRAEEATAALCEAVGLYQRKGNVAAVAQARIVLPVHQLA